MMTQAEMQQFVDGICKDCERGDVPIAPPYSSIVGSAPVHSGGMICVKSIPREQRELLATHKGWQRESGGSK